MRTAVLTSILTALVVAGCCSPLDRRLDPERPEAVMARRVARFEAGVSADLWLPQLRAGDVILFSSEEASSGSSAMVAIAFSEMTHAAIVFPQGPSHSPRCLTADSDQGVIVQSPDRCVGGRPFYLYRFPPESVNVVRLTRFAERAASLGTFDYDFSAAFWGLNSDLTPDDLHEIAGEYTCATVVAAALHFSGLSLDRAHCGYGWVSPDDLIYSRARHNLNYARR